MQVFNIIIIIYNFITTFFGDGVSIVNIAILCFNLFMTITALKKNKKNVPEIICLVFEVLTGLAIAFSLLSRIQ